MKVFLPATFILLLTGFYTQAQNANQTLSNLLSPTAVNTNLSPGTNNTRNLGTALKSWRILYLDSSLYLKDSLFLHKKGARNTFVGTNSGFLNTTGRNNTAVGYRSLYTNTTGHSNTVLGSNALTKNTTGAENTAIGYSALFTNSQGSSNTAIGYSALILNTVGISNTGIGSSALFSNKTGNSNTAIGDDALFFNMSGSFNSAFGASALRSNTIGQFNVAMGFNALFKNIAGTNNSAYGYRALYNNTGSNSTAIGASSLSSNTTGTDNTTIGFYSLHNNTSGSRNTAAGQALMFNSLGSDNTAQGYQALYKNRNGNFNTAVGGNTLFRDSSRQYNVAVGYNAGGGRYNGSNNTFVGANSNANANDYTNSSALGYNSLVTASNQVVVGNSSITSIIAGTGFVIYSDGRFKKNIKENVPGLEFIKELRPVTYTYDIHGLDAARDGKDARGNEPDGTTDKEALADLENARKEKEKKIYTGLVAQDVEKVAEKMGYDFSGIYKPQNENDVYGLSYSEFIMPLIKAVQELNEEVTQLKEQIKAMAQKTSNESYLSFLGQNVPNPFSSTTVIPYQVKSGSRSAMMQITETGTGKVIKRIPLNVNTTQVTVAPGFLATGSYIYSLIVDGKKVDSKQMLMAVK